MLTYALNCVAKLDIEAVYYLRANCTALVPPYWGSCVASALVRFWQFDKASAIDVEWFSSVVELIQHKPLIQLIVIAINSMTLYIDCI